MSTIPEAHRPAGRTVPVIIIVAVSAVHLAAGNTDPYSPAAAAAPIRIAAIPPRPPHAISGSQFVKNTAHLSPLARQRAALTELRRGNVPDFMRLLYPVEISLHQPDTASMKALLWVSPDYVAIGCDSDFLRIPLAYSAATEIARCFGCILPTQKVVDTVYRQARVRLAPQPLRAGPFMRTAEYWLWHQRLIEEQCGPDPVPGIVAGNKKDVVLTNLLWKRAGRVAIYGWHTSGDSPIQPLSTVHGEDYADYSHGVRLVRDSLLIERSSYSVYAVLQDSALAPLISYEGVIHDPQKLMRLAQKSPRPSDSPRSR